LKQPKIEAFLTRMCNLNNQFNGVPIVILSGGNGILLNEKQSLRLNKGLIKILNKPLFIWVIAHYVLHGASEFLIAAGMQFESFSSELNAFGASRDPQESDCYHIKIAGKSCIVRIINTPINASTLDRITCCREIIEDRELFAVTYSDTLSDVDLSSELHFHKNHRLTATLVSAKLPVRFRILGVRPGETLVRGFASRPVIESANINGGYYIFSKKIWADLKYLGPLEIHTLENLAFLGELAAFEHNGRWQNCDAERDLNELTAIALSLQEKLTLNQ
jgi:glucose-1-phosphate cytidylyltransferase